MWACSKESYAVLPTAPRRACLAEAVQRWKADEMQSRADVGIVFSQQIHLAPALKPSECIAFAPWRVAAEKLLNEAMHARKAATTLSI